MKITTAAGFIALACGLAFAHGTPSLAQTASSPVKSLGNFSHIVANMDRSVALC